MEMLSQLDSWLRYSALQNNLIRGGRNLKDEVVKQLIRTRIHVDGPSQVLILRRTGVGCPTKRGSEGNTGGSGSLFGSYRGAHVSKCVTVYKKFHPSMRVDAHLLQQKSTQHTQHIIMLVSARRCVFKCFFFTPDPRGVVFY